jgi:glycosyltransferase involved in cell wall biosynthesis
VPDASDLNHGVLRGASRPRLLLLERKLDTQGGVAAVAAWTLQALSRDYDLTLLCWKAPNLGAMNRFFGTSLQAGDFKVIATNPMIRGIVALDPDPGSIQSWCVLLRRCQRIQHRYELVLGGELEADFGVPGIQYLVCSAISSLYPRVCHRIDTSGWRRIRSLIRGELRPWMLVARFSFEQMKKNVTLTDSNWIGELVHRAYGIETTTVYPPASGNFARTPWRQREDGFVCVGRLNPDKRIEWIIETLARVRTQFPDLKLHIAGSLDSTPDAGAYRRKVAALTRSNANWVYLHENLSRPDLIELLSRNRYGIHAHTEEHFGIAVAEMLLAGCIPFVYRRGGPAEIVEYDPRLIYASQNEAVERILGMVGDPVIQQETIAKLEKRAPLFTAERFMEGIRTAVASELARRTIQR